MKPARLVATPLFLALAAWVAPFAIAAIAAIAACGQPRTPDAASEADAGELTCSERAQAQKVCQGALVQRCESQSHDCESNCDVRELPANDEKTPTERGVVEADQCRQNCVHGRDGCLHTVVQRCPAPCP